MIQPAAWDSRLLGLPVGTWADFDAPLTDRECADYALVLARVPQQRRDVVAKLEAGGFRYVGLDLRLTAAPDEPARSGDECLRIRRVSHAAPDFQIAGFQIAESRLMLDPACRARLPQDFWDRLVYEHCTDFADTVLCAVAAANHLAGFASCLLRPGHLDLFMVAVHPSQQGHGLGGALVREAAALARERGLRLSTSVMASNVRGFNFYLRHGFLVANGEVVMHRWREREPECPMTG